MSSKFDFILDLCSFCGSPFDRYISQSDDLYSDNDGNKSNNEHSDTYNNKYSNLYKLVITKFDFIYVSSPLSIRLLFGFPLFTTLTGP